MHIHCKLVMLILALTLDGQVYTVEIYGGREAVPHSRPYTVLLERLLDSSVKGYCDGFLLNEDFVMTAAHCKASSYNVLLGVHNFHNHLKLNISVEQSFPHIGYNWVKGAKNDMLLKLSSIAKFSHHVKPIALAGSGDHVVPQRCLVSGWAASDTKTHSMTPRLMEVHVTLIEDDTCSEELLYCSAGETGPARGDSGGPLVCEDGKAYGVVSFTFRPDPPNYPPIYAFTQIPEYTGWIDRTINF